VRGVLHRAAGPPEGALVVAHGAGSSAGAPLLVALAEALAAAGTTVLRCDLPFRQARPQGPPRPADAARDREGLRAAVEALRALTAGPVALGGHSYGGRQASLLASEAPALVPALLLLAYPHHPPGTARLRTDHFPRLRTPALFVHGTRDPFGSPGELEAAMAAIPARTELLVVAGGAHALAATPGARAALAARVAARWRQWRAGVAS
jgi:hypothetical protein